MTTTDKVITTYAVLAVCVFMYFMSDMETKMGALERFLGALFIAALWPVFAVLVPVVTAYEKIMGRRP